MDTSVTASPMLARVIADMLRSHGVERMFGIPGGGSSLALIEAAGTAGIDFVLTRTETAAAIMAAVTAEITGIPGVVMTGVGPGAASAVNGVAYAHLEKAPLLIFTDGPASSLHQDFDQQALFAPITKMQARLRPQNGQADLGAALSAALARPWGPVHLELTAGDATMPVSGQTGPLPEASAAAVDSAALERAHTLLSRARRPAIIAGLDARYGECPRRLSDLATSLSCPVLTTYKAKGVLPDSHSGACGLFTGAAAEGDILHKADLIILFGFDPVETIPGSWNYEAKVVDLTAIERETPNIQVTARVVADPAATVSALLGADMGKDWQSGELSGLRASFRDRLSLDGDGHTVQTVLEALAGLAPGECRLTVDSGAHMFSALACWNAEEPFGVLKSNGLSTMGYALPAAIASSLHQPERPVVAVTGDGGMMMCLSELATALEHDCDITVIVINDDALSLIDIKQQGHQYRSKGVTYPGTDFAACAKAMGCRAWRVEAGDALEPALRDALEGRGPAVIDVVADASGYPGQLAALRG